MQYDKDTEVVMHRETTDRWFIFQDGAIREINETDDIHMGGETVVRVETLGKNHYRIVCEVYYSSEDVWALEITGALDKALRCAAVALEFDAEQN